MDGRQSKSTDGLEGGLNLSLWNGYNGCSGHLHPKLLDVVWYSAAVAVLRCCVVLRSAIIVMECSNVLCSVVVVAEGSIEVECPTIWTDENQRWEEAEKRREVLNLVKLGALSDRQMLLCVGGARDCADGQKSAGSESFVAVSTTTTIT